MPTHGTGDGSLWYVAQTQSGSEQRMMAWFERLADHGRYRKCFVPMFEDVRKRGGNGQIVLRRFFPGYFFIETEEPEYVYRVLRKIPDFARLLGTKEKDGAAVFLPVEKEEEAFLGTLLEDGLMRVSYVVRDAKGRAKSFVGPLAQYSNRITRLDVMRRRAIVEAEIFGKRRKFKFGLWTKDDPELYRFKELSGKEEKSAAILEGIDIGIHPGERVRDISGIWAEEIFTVLSVDPGRRLIRTSYDIMGTTAGLTLMADQVERVE